VQRLVQKEKHVLQLQSEIDQLKSSNPIEIRESVRFPAYQRVFVLTFAHVPKLNKQDERAKREREKTKWTSVMDEIAKLKTQVGFCIDREYILFIVWRVRR
jgi:diaphanous 1